MCIGVKVSFGKFDTIHTIVTQLVFTNHRKTKAINLIDKPDLPKKQMTWLPECFIRHAPDRFYNADLLPVAQLLPCNVLSSCTCACKAA